MTLYIDMNHYIVHMNHKWFDITVHGIEPGLYHRLEQRARRRGTSLNRTLKAILEEALGTSTPVKANPFADLCGSLPADAVAELLEHEREHEQVDPEAWV